MKSLKEISKNIASLSEGMFDMQGEDRLAKGVEKDTTEAFLKSCKGNFTYVLFKDGSVRVNGKLIISGITADKLHLNCRDFHGKLIIENCPNLTTLEGSFLEKIYVFDGSITINQCPSLVSIDGISGMVKGDVSITNCKKLKSLGTLESVLGNLYWEKNGKKLTAEEISKKTHVIKKIYCSEEEIEADVVEGVVNEAFNNPWLQRLAAQLKKYPYKEYSWDDKAPDKHYTVDELFRKYGRLTGMSGVGRLIDKITNDDIDVYDMGDNDDKKDLGKAFYNSYSNEDPSASDLVLVYDEDLREFTEGYGYIAKPRGQQVRGIERFFFPTSKNSGRNNKISDYNISKTEARQNLLGLGTGYTVVVINSGKDKGNESHDRYKIRQERIASQEGSITPGDVEQYKKIAADNIKRYKEIIAKNKAMKKKEDNGEYDQLIDRYEQINVRTFKFIRAIAKDPKAFDRWKVGGFIEWTRDEKKWAHGSYGRTHEYGEYGLIYYFKNFMDSYMDVFGNSYKSSPDESDYKDLERQTNALKTALDKADEKLKGFGF